MPHMHGKLCRPMGVLLLCGLLACPQLPAQGSQSGSTADDPHELVKPDPKRAKKLVELGAKREAAGAYEEALAAYDQATRYAPFDVNIVGKAAALRSRLVQSYVDKAEQLTVKGNYLEASEQLAAALQVDPTNAVLLERLKQVDNMRTQVKDTPEEPPEGMPQLAPAKGKRNFRLQTDLQSAFEQVAAAFGLKVTFDPDIPARNVRLRLEDVDFETAMKVLSIETGTFWKALNAKLIFVAPDTSEKRKAFETVIEQTFLLTDSISPTEMTDVVRAVRDLTGTNRIQQSSAARSLTIRDTVPRVRLAGAVIKDLQKARGEVLLEMQFLEVDRDTAMQLGITPPPSLSLYSVPPNLAEALRVAPSYTALLTLLAGVFGAAATGGLSSLASAIPPVAAFGGGKSTFLLELPTISADFSKSLSLVHSGREVLLRAEDGNPATFFVGERYPITLSLLSGSLGSTGFTASVGGTATALKTEQFAVGQGPVALASADFRGSGNQDIAVVNQVDNTLTILLNQGPGVGSQFAQATGSPIVLGPAASSSTPAGIVSPAVSLTVTNAVLQSIAISPAAASIAPRGALQFSALGTFNDGTTQDISSDVNWASSNTAVATIGAQSGLALGQGVGTTQITATLGTVSSAAAALTGTNAALQSISLSPATASIARNGTQQFIATGTFSDGSKQDLTTTASWSSSNTSVATVGVGSGLVRGVNAGSALLRATLGSLSSAQVSVAVTAATLKSISVTPVNLAIASGTSAQYSATGTYSDGSTQNVTASVAWTSSKTSVATIGASSGLASGIAVGATSITASQGGAGSPSAIAIGSLNTVTDSIPDLVVASQINNSVIVLLGNGDGTFTNPRQAVSYVVGNQPSGIVLGTFNLSTDGNLGFVVTNFADNSYSSFTGNADGTFTEVKGSPFHLPSDETGPIGITSGDFNGDGKPDLAIVNETSNNVTILEGNGDGTFREFTKSPVPTGNFPVAISSGTLAGSTGPGLAIANQNDNSVTVYLGTGDGTFATSSQSPLATTSAPGGVTIADFIGTSTGGIGVTNRDSGTVTVYLNVGSGLFTEALEPAAGTSPDAIITGTFTGNTFPDILVTNDISGAAGTVTLLVSPTSLIATPSNAQTPYPGSEYVDIGLKVKTTPYVHPDGEVTLQMDYEIKALSGSNYNGIPVITNQSVTQTIRLKEGETSVVTGLLDREETKALTGIPGLAKIPYAGYLFGSEDSSFTNNELLILITPRKLRVPTRESRNIYAGHGEIGGRASVGAGAPAEPPPTAPSTEPQERRPENPPTAAPGPPQAVTPQPANPPPPAQPSANPENQPQPNTPPQNPPEP
jgi:type II secretory pathway component GspD/PulD (secretin)